MNVAAARELKEVKHRIESGEYKDALALANRHLEGIPTHDRAMFHHRAAMAADKQGSEDVARSHYEAADSLFMSLEIPDVLGHAILDRDRAMFEMRSAPWGNRTAVADRWLPVLEQDYRSLHTLQGNGRVAKEARVMVGFITRLSWRADPGRPCHRKQLEDDWRDIAELCRQDGTKYIYELDALDEVLRTSGRRSPFRPDARLLRASQLSAQVGNLSRSLGYLVATPLKDGIYATGVGVLRPFS